MRRFSIALCVVALCGAGIAQAVDVWGGPPDDTWNRGDEGSTYQHWDFNTSDLPSVPEMLDNPYGTPVAELTSDWEYGEQWPAPEDIDPDGTVDGWHSINPDGSFMRLIIPNNPVENEVKYIFLQITVSKGVQVSAEGINLDGTVGTTAIWDTGRPQIQHPGPAPFDGSWYTYNFGFEIRPNPAYEIIDIYVPFCGVVDQIVVDTICTPEPTAIIPLTLAGLIGLRRRR